MSLFKKLFFLLGIGLMSSFSFAEEQILVCESPSVESMTITSDGQNLILETKFTYWLFDGIYKALFPGRPHIPSDFHQAALTMTMPEADCRQSETDLNCAPESSTFATDRLGTVADIKIKNIVVTKNSQQVQLTVRLARAEKTAEENLVFSADNCIWPTP